MSSNDAYYTTLGTYTTEIFIKEFNISVNYLQREQLIVRFFDGTAEVQAGISSETKDYQII